MWIRQEPASGTDQGWLATVVAFLQDHPVTASIAATIVLVLLAYLSDKITKSVLVRTVGRIVERTSVTWDDLLQRHGFFTRLAHLAPVLAIYYGIALVPGLPEAFASLIQHAALAAMVLVAVLAADALLSTTGEIYTASALAHGRPIKGYIQGAKIILYIVGGIVAISALTGQSPLILLSGFAALSAVLLLVFRDTILSFVASMQIASYDMMREGDWIEMPQYGADGDVVDIGLHTIRVQNWDKTVTSIPTHRFLSDSFKNWRSMSESGGRRIKRAIHIDMSSIRFLEDADIERFENFLLLKDYMQEKKREIEEYNARVGDTGLVANARRLTNIGTFRAYVVRYLRDHPMTHKRMTMMVRQLSPTPQGLPLEIYMFSNEIDWVTYEGIQSDIFDHIIGIVPEFGLKIFQTPSGQDLEAAVTRYVDAE
jgi:miniconductance mechanosensitive channel